MVYAYTGPCSTIKTDVLSRFRHDSNILTPFYLHFAVTHCSRETFSVQNKSVFSRGPRLSTWHCLHIVAERRRLLSIDISCPPGAQQQTCRTQLLPLIDGTDKRTDGRSIVSKTLLRQCQ